jgi:hypothetical protein
VGASARGPEEVLSCLLPGRTARNDEKPQSGTPVSGQRFETSTS